jgi:hypothetical protein
MQKESIDFADTVKQVLFYFLELRLQGEIYVFFYCRIIHHSGGILLEF